MRRFVSATSVVRVWEVTSSTPGVRHWHMPGPRGVEPFKPIRTLEIQDDDRFVNVSATAMKPPALLSPGQAQLFGGVLHERPNGWVFGMGPYTSGVHAGLASLTARVCDGSATPVWSGELQVVNQRSRRAPGTLIAANPTSGFSVQQGYSSDVGALRLVTTEAVFPFDVDSQANFQPYQPSAPHLESGLNVFGGSNARHDIANAVTPLLVNLRLVQAGMLSVRETAQKIIQGRMRQHFLDLTAYFLVLNRHNPRMPRSMRTCPQVREIETALAGQDTRTLKRVMDRLQRALEDFDRYYLAVTVPAGDYDFFLLPRRAKAA